jgi:Domain of unknown function (DUF1839)
MTVDVLGLDPSTYRSHALHGPDRVWTETNCAADLWIEALHALGHDPVAGLGFTLGTDFDGDQWRMFTYPAETLHLLYGIGVDELNVWRPLRRHVGEQLSLGNLVAFDADAWWLPDTAGLTYRSVHQKTTVLATMIDLDAGRLGYLHNTGYYELGGDDFEALLPAAPPSSVMPPFTLQVRLGGLRPTGSVNETTVRRLAAVHLARRPVHNPVLRLGARVAADVGRLRADGLDAFHRWAFGTVRQCGANAELAAAFARRLATGGLTGASTAGEAFDEVAVGMKAAELALARAVRGRQVDVEALFRPLAERWAAAIDWLAAGLAGAAEAAAPARTARRQPVSSGR